MTRNSKPRLALTRKGDLVELNTTTEVDGGWVGYVLNNNGDAVEVFIPGS